MSCHTSSEYMMKFFDKQANDIETAYMNKHIKTCSKCREEYKNLSEILSCIETKNDIEPPEDFETQVMSRIRQVKEQTAVKGEKMLIFLYGLTTVVLLIVVAGMISGLKEVSIVNLLNELYNNKSLSETGLFSSEVFYNSILDFYSFAKGILRLMFELTVMFMRSYSYIFGISLTILLMLQKLYVNLLGRVTGRGIE